MSSFNWNPEFTIEQVTGGKMKKGYKFQPAFPGGCLSPCYRSRSAAMRALIFSGGRWSFSSAEIGFIPKNTLDLVL